VSISVPLRLRPLEIGDLLDETFRMYRRHFLLFAGISVILAIPSAALLGVIFGWFSIVIDQTTGMADLWLFLAAAGATALVNLLIIPFTYGAVIFAACESAIGRPVTAGSVFRGVSRRYFPLLGYWTLFFITLGLAVLLCIAPVALWLWVFVGWIAVTPAMFVENIGLGPAMGRSWNLVKGRWWRTFLILLLMYIVWYVAGIALGAFIQLAQFALLIVLSPVIATGVAVAASQLISAVLTPVMQILIVLIYFDLRVRREALDLFQMAYQLSAPPALP
jgi:hypothetical protein